MYDDYYEKKNVKDNSNINKILNIIMIVIGVIMFIVIIIWIVSPKEETKTHTDVVKNEKYTEYEKKLEEAANKYYSTNVLSTSEKYLSASSLGISIPSNCSSASGVITSGNLNKAYLLCSDYETEIIETDPKNPIKLVGKNIYMVIQGTVFSDPGYISREPVTVTGSVGDIEGVYNILYMGRNSSDTVTRKVIVTNDESIKSMFPTIKLNGEEAIYMLKGQKYVDAGATATDPKEGDITYKINKTGNVNYNEVGEYKITYSVSNQSGFTVSLTRLITVLSDITSLEMVEEVNTTDKTNEAVSINMKVLGENYAYSYLPTGEKITDSEFTYEATDNGIYHFWAYDTYGRNIEKTVKIDNIDKKTPTITCDANVYGNHVDVIVTSISKPISKYKFIVDGFESKFLDQTSYVRVTNKFTSAKVEVIDEAGNHSTKECNPVKKDPTIGNNNIKYYNYGGTEYVIANTKNDLTTFVNMTRGKISQSAFSGTDDPYNCTSACLSFSLYHAGYIQVGDLSKMDPVKACRWNSIKAMTHTFYGSKGEALSKVYNEITSGNVCVLQVTGTKARNSRHFVLVVGYKRDKYSASELREEDLLTIDSWTGDFCTLSEADTSKRTMFSRAGQGYRVDHF